MQLVGLAAVLAVCAVVGVGGDAHPVNEPSDRGVDGGDGVRGAGVHDVRHNGRSQATLSVKSLEHFTARLLELNAASCHKRARTDVGAAALLAPVLRVRAGSGAAQAREAQRASAGR